MMSELDAIARALGDFDPVLSIRPFAAVDAVDISIQDAQAYDWPEGDERLRYARMLAAGGMAFTFRDRQDRVLMCCGVFRNHDQHGTAWAMVSPLASTHLLQITRIVRGYFADLAMRRIDFTVRTDFKDGHRWADLLGFQRESLKSCFMPDGGDVREYVRIREGGS